MVGLHFLFAILLLTPAICSGCPLPENHVALFVFGDSLLDAGNNQYLPNGGNQTLVWPYGETFFHNATGRVSDGRIPPDFIAEYANLPLIKPYCEPGFVNFTNGANFASAGAGVFPETRPGLLYMGLQISYFEKAAKKLSVQLGDAEAKKLISRSVYLFSMGGNDYMSLTMGPNQTITSELRNKYIGMVIGNYSNAIKAIYVLGGRKFVFQNVGPLGCMPSAKAQAALSGNATVPDCIKTPQLLAKMHNAAFATFLKGLSTKLPEFKYVLFDYYTALSRRTLSAAQYGFKEGKSACCGTGAYNGNFACGKMNGTAIGFKLCQNPSDYVWFDPGHPTESTNKQLSDILWNGHPNYVTGNVKSFFKEV